MKIMIAKEEDRLIVAAILIKNGYQVRQDKEQRTKTSRAYVHYLIADRADDNKTGG